MNYTLSFVGGIGELVCRPSFTYQDGVSALQAVLDSPWRDEMRGLLVLDEGSAFSPTAEDIGTVVALMNRILELEDVRIAIVVAKIVHYGIGRVLEARIGPRDGRVRVFLRAEAAREWLGAHEISPAV